MPDRMPDAVFVEVAIPLNVHQTFTYRVPEGLGGEVRTGCRVVVPFGRQLLTGYVVETHQTLAETGQNGAELKEIDELLETDPLVTPELIALTRWMADYYYAPWGEVIKSSLPAGINVEGETIVTVTADGRQAWEKNGERLAGRSSKWQVLGRLVERGEVSLRELTREEGGAPGKARMLAVLRALERDGMVQLRRQRQEPGVRVKRQQAVRRLAGPGESEKVRPRVQCSSTCWKCSRRRGERWGWPSCSKGRR